MKRLVCLVAMVSLVAASSCGQNAIAPLHLNGTPLAFLRAASFPPTVHVIPFYDYGKAGYQGLHAPGGSGGLSGSEAALYGTTLVGGSTSCSTVYDSGSETGCGIAYRLVPKSGKQAYKLDVLYEFQGAPGDGAASAATLVADKSGDLYGTTVYGGEYDEGTLFKLHPSSSGFAETIVHNFGYGQDGEYPLSGMIEVNGMLYGTTLGGGTYTNKNICIVAPNDTCGTVYSLNPATGAEQVLHSFGQIGDGANPFDAPLDVAGTMYGTTYAGGSNAACGTVYSIGADGSGEKIVHSFLNAPDGCDPLDSLIAVKGTLYGTTASGGGNFCSHCEGTLFGVDISTSKEQVLHQFGEGKDGSEPVDALVNVRGVLYGTTSIGGRSSCDSGLGCGTIFSLAPSPSSASYKVLHRFTGGADGSQPYAELLYTNGALYGTTIAGGKRGLGTGVKLAP